MRIKMIAFALAAALPVMGVQAFDVQADDIVDVRQQWQQANQQLLMQALNLNEAQRQEFMEKSEAFRKEQLERTAAFQQSQQNQRERHRDEIRKLLNPEQQVIYDQHQGRMDEMRNSRRQQGFMQQR